MGVTVSNWGFNGENGKSWLILEVENSFERNIHDSCNFFGFTIDGSRSQVVSIR